MNEYEIIYLAQEQNEEAEAYLYQKYSYIIDILIAKNQNKLQNLNIDIDAYNICLQGLNDAIINYNADANASFATFATIIMERRINNFFHHHNSKKNQALNKSISLNQEYKDNILLSHTIDYQSDPLNTLKDQENYKELLKNIKENLSVFEYEVYLLLLQDLTYQQIAKLLNKTPKQIDNAIQRIKNKLIRYKN